MNAFELFSTALRERPDHLALVSGLGNRRQALSFGDLNRRVDHVAAELQRNGLQPGDRVLLTVPMSVDTFIVMLALLKAGLVTMVIDPGHGADRIASILRAWPPAALIGTRSILLFRFLVPELRAIPKRFVVNGSSAGAASLDTRQEAPAPVAVVPRAPADSALLSFTSGSTGEPKPVTRSHGFLRQQMAILQPVARFEVDDVDFVAMPMFVLFNLANGITSVLPACDIKHPGRADSRVIAEQLRSEGATRTVASPALLDRLAGYCMQRSILIPSLRVISTGGGPVRPGLPGKLKRIAPGATVRMVYGSTEAEPIAAIDDHEVSVTAARRMRSGGGLLVGRPVEGCAVRIVENRPGAVLGPFTRHAFDQLELPTGQIGEIVVSGRHVLSSYADAARNAETKIGVDGATWHRTGDAGYFDEAGRLWLVGRCAAAIRDAAGTVYPFQVEYAMSDTAGVRRAALVSRGGKRVLVLETRGSEFNTDCVAAANCVLAHQVDRIVATRRIPVDRRHDAKIDYPALQRLLDGRWARARLFLAESISSAFRGLRYRYRAIAGHCQSGRSGTKVGACRLKMQ